MNKEIKYNGHTATPSDYECADGDLAVAMNVVPEDGAIKAVLQPKVEMTLEPGTTIIYIHESANFKNYILVKEYIVGTTAYRHFQWINDGSSTPKYLMQSFKGDFYQTNAVGNTLLLLTSEGMYYFLFKDDKYIPLGNKLPECEITFGLQATIEKSDNFSIDIQYDFALVGGNWTNELSDSNKKKISEQVLGKVNKFIAEKATNSNRFIYPFFVRYAYRLYDGTLTMHSAPVLMICSTTFAPQVYAKKIIDNPNGEYGYITGAFVCAALHQLDFSVKDESHIENLKKWSDIIRSVDIFISAPIYTYDQNGECKRFIDADLDDDYAICKHINQQSKYDSKYPKRYQFKKTREMYCFTFLDMITNGEGKLAFDGEPPFRIELPSRSVDKIKNDIISSSLFYYISSVELDNLSTEREIVPIKDEFLKSLQTHEVMTDDYRSHDRLIPKQSFVYNSRLNLSGLSTELFNGFNNGQSYSDGYVKFSEEPISLDYTVGFNIYIFINENGRKYVVKSGMTIGLDAPLLYFFYPNVNAYKLIAIPVSYNRMPAFEVPLTPHEMLNGAIYFAGFGLEKKPGVTSSYEVTDRVVNVPNKIYTSEVNNPFRFPVLGINTIGTGTILGMSSAAKALSQGQFGQFPLYAFTTEGVWALEVSSTGSYSAKQPITRDVCINPRSITQIDSSVLFVTERGIMLISGSNSMCISDTIDSDAEFSLDSLPGGNKVLKLSGLKTEKISIRPFKKFLDECRMLYDYVHQRIIAFNTSKDKAYAYAYVYSLKSKLWGMMESDISSGVNSYPEALAMDKNGNLVNFSQNDADSISAMVVTRPFKFDMVDVHKTIGTVIQRGDFRAGHVKSVLYGSNDLRNWHLVWSSKDHFLRGFRGTPYKYFRLVLLCTLSNDESIYGSSVQFTPRLTNQLR